MLASITASQHRFRWLARPRSDRSGSRHCARSSRSARDIPRMATKPSGLPETSSAATTPIRPSGTTLSTRKRRLKALQLNIRTVSMMSSISGTTAIDRGLRLAALLDRTADGDPIAFREALRSSLATAACKRSDHGLRADAPAPRRPERSASGRGRAARSGDSSCSILEGRELARVERCGRSEAGTAGCAGSRATRAARRSRARRRRPDRCRRAPAVTARPTPRC